MIFIFVGGFIAGVIVVVFAAEVAYEYEIRNIVSKRIIVGLSVVVAAGLATILARPAGWRTIERYGVLGILLGAGATLAIGIRLFFEI